MASGRYGHGEYGTDTYGAPSVDSIHAPAAQFWPRIESIHAPQVNNRAKLQSLHAPEAGLGLLQSLHAPQVQNTVVLQSLHAPQVDVWPSEFHKAFIAAPSGSSMSTSQPLSFGNVLSYGVKLKLYNVSAGTTDDLTSYLRSWRLEQGRSSPCDFTLELVDKDRELRPFLSSGDTFYGKFRCDNYDDNWNIRRYLQLEITINGATWLSPWLLPTRYRWGQEDAATVTLTGTDLSDMLLQKPKVNADGEGEFSDYVSTSTHLYTAREIVADLLKKRGITTYSLEFTDYPIAKYSPKGTTVLDMIKEILWVVQAEWYFDRNVFVARDRDYNPSGPAKWTWVDRYHIKQVSCARSIEGLVNQVTIKKTEQSNVLGEQECTGGDCIGYQTVSLSSPANVAQLDIEEIVKYKDSGNFVPTWFDANDKVLGNGWTYSGTTPASSVQWVYEPDFDATFTTSDFVADWTPHYKVVVYGKTATSMPDWPQFDAGFEIIVDNTNNQALYGVRPDNEAVENTLIPNAEYAEALGNKLIAESIRRMREGVFEAVLNPFIMPCDMGKITFGLGGAYDTIWYTELVVKEGTAEAATMSLTMTMHEVGEA
jgi:hypothetical protein